MTLESLKSQVNNQKTGKSKGKMTKNTSTFIQNKPNSKNIKIGVIPFQTSKYEILPAWRSKKQTQFKPNTNPLYFNAIIDLSSFITSKYVRLGNTSDKKTNPIQSQNKPNKLVLECRSWGANKNTLKIYPFGIDCPIVFEEKLFRFVG